MATKRHKPEEIVTTLRQVEVLVGQGMARVDAIREVRISEQTFYRWRKQYGGMGTDQLRELKRLQKENERLRRAVSDLTLDKLILAEAAKGNFIRPLSSDQWRSTVSSRSPPCLHRSRSHPVPSVRETRLPCLGSAPIHAEEGAAWPCR